MDCRCRGTPSVYCLGKCYAGPSDGEPDRAPTLLFAAGRPCCSTMLSPEVCAILRRIAPREEEPRGEGPNNGAGRAGRTDCKIWITRARWSWLSVWSQMASGSVATDAVKYWWSTQRGDPGAFSDRFLLEGDPFRLIEAAMIAARGRGDARLRLRAQGIPGCCGNSARCPATGQGGGLAGAGFDLTLVVGEAATSVAKKPQC